LRQRQDTGGLCFEKEIMEYNQFIEGKHIKSQSRGIDVDQSEINAKLFPFQRDVTACALRKGRALLGLDTGLGKTYCQLEWARLVIKHGAVNRVLIVAPLSVARQTVRMSHDIDVTVTYVRGQAEVEDSGIYITNYEMIDKFDASRFGGVVLDESSILKALDGKTRLTLTSMFHDTPFRLCCTATPAPNDETEIGNHAEFLGVMRNNEMLATFFVHANKVEDDIVQLGNGKTAHVKTKQAGSKGQEWRLRNYGRQEFYRWLSSWAMMIQKPSDLGYEDNGFILPALNISPIFCDVDYCPEGQLFFTGLSGIQDRTKIRRETLGARVETAAWLVNESDEQWIVWCGLQSESDTMTESIEGAIEVKGADSSEDKAAMLEEFQDGKYRVLVTKPKIAGFGMNFQNSHNMVFVGLGDSWESYYQCIRREWRYGQTAPVNVYIVLSEIERQIFDNVMRKERAAQEMKDALISNIELYEKEELGMVKIELANYTEDIVTGEGWTAMLGDSCVRLKELAGDSIDMSVYSPPFADLYTYSASERDLGNSRNWDEFFEHYSFIIQELYRVHKPGCVTCVHTADIPALQMKDGYIGLRDFPGEVIKAYQAQGWIYHGWAVVTKNPQAQAIRTKAKALLFVQLKKDSSCSRPAILDRILFFKKPGDRDVPVTPVERGEIDNERWIEWAGGIWTGISESNTLQYTTARAADDEKHICPLQLGTIERCIKLYSNPGELVLTPFMGIGSEVYQAIKFGRRGIGIELKESYFNIAVNNLRNVERETNEVDLFSLAETTA